MADFAVKITLAASSPVPTYNVAPWVSGVLRMASGDATGSDLSGLLTDLSPIGEYADIARGGNYAAIEDWSFAMMAVYDGAKWWLAFGAAGASMLGANVEVIDTTAATTRAVGVVTAAKLAGSEVSVTCESVATKRHKEIPTRRITAVEFPGLTEQFEGAVVPIVYGPAERLEPASFLTEPEYLPALYIPTLSGSIRRESTFAPTYAGAPAPSASSLPIVTSIGSVVAIPEIADALSDGKLFVTITDGAGSGQERLVTGITSSTGSSAAGVFESVSILALASPLDSLPDTASEIRLIRRDVGAVLAVCDEGVVSGVRDAEFDSPMPFVQGTMATGIVSADISSEFQNGENYQSVDYRKPSTDFGAPELSDGISTASPRVVRAYGYKASYGAGLLTGDMFCRSRLDLESVDDDLINKHPVPFGLISMEVTGYGPSDVQGIYALAKATRWDGAEEIIHISTDKLIDAGEVANCYSPAMASDGTPGNFAAYAFEIGLDRPLSQYKSILIGACFVTVPTGFPGSETYGPYPYIQPNVSFVNGADYVVWDTSIHGPIIAPYVPAWIGPCAASDPAINAAFSADHIYTTDKIFLPAGSMRGVLAIQFISGTVYHLLLDGTIDAPTGLYSARVGNSAAFVPGVDPGWGTAPLLQVNEYESGIAFSFGDIPQNSTFLANMASGRTTSGTPITLAKEAAVDIMKRDLGLTSAEIDGASFAALPDDAIRMAIAEAENSGEIIARMAREFNWIVAHDGAGKERAKTWLDRVGTSDVDWYVTSADTLKNSLSESMTSIGDVICEPRTEWDWTVADGFRESGYITDITTLPASLTADNYLRTISGFGDYTTSLAVFTALHNAYKEALERGPQSVEYQYGGDPASLYVGDLAAWCAARKLILDFKVSEAAAAAACVVGDRIAIAHKRATNNATKHGTICGRWWHPMDGAVQILAMMDPE